jgi:hypothetical protein
MLLLVFLAACSGGDDVGARFDAASPTAKGSAPASQQPKTVTSGKLRPPAPARMFAGTPSQVGLLTHYCKNATCEEIAARTPAFLTSPQGAFVLFTIGEMPEKARAEVRTGPSDNQPAVVGLERGTLMVFNHGLPPGRYLVDLLVTWKAAEARWRFGISVKK